MAVARHPRRVRRCARPVAVVVATAVAALPSALFVGAGSWKSLQLSTRRLGRTNSAVGHELGLPPRPAPARRASAADAQGSLPSAAAVAAGALTVVVAGATGRAGGALLRSLRGVAAARAVRPVALVRDAAKARSLFGEDVDALEADYGDPAALAAALRGLGGQRWRLFLVCANSPSQAELELNVLQAAAASSCEYVVKLSTVRTAIESRAGPSPAHIAVEEALGSAGVPHTVLRPNLFMQMMLSGPLGVAHLLKDTDECEHVFAESCISMIDARDVAAVATELLIAPDPAAHDGDVLDLTGPAAVSASDVVEAASALRPRPATCRPRSMDDFVSGMGLPAGVGARIGDFFSTVAASDFLAGEMERICGHPPRSLAAFVRDHSRAFLPSAFSRLAKRGEGASFREAVASVRVDTEQALDALGPQQVFVKVLVAGINGAADTAAAARGEADAPLGNEGVGRVVVAGAGVEGLRVGDLVSFMGGAYAEFVALDAARCLAVPAQLPPEELAALRVAGLTAVVALERTAGVRAGDVVLVTAAAGGTGAFAVQVAKLAGATVVGTVGSPEKVEAARALGCDRVVNYREEDLGQVLKTEFPRGIDVAFEGVGGQLFRAAHDNLAPGGRLLLVGAISTYSHNETPEEHGIEGLGELMDIFRAGETVDLGDGKRLLGNVWGDAFGAGAIPALRDRVHALHADGRIRAFVDRRRFEGLASVPDAVEHMLGGTSVGKVWVRCCL